MIIPGPLLLGCKSTGYPVSDWITLVFTQEKTNVNVIFFSSMLHLVKSAYTANASAIHVGTI